ncbi:MAG: restriction endonuclease subunit S [Candidatus Paceibacterota bacterium]
MIIKGKQINISEKWKTIEVGKIFDFLRSYAVSRENLVEDTRNDKGIGNIHYGDIHAKFNATNIDLNNVSVPMAKDDGFTPNKEDFLIDGDLIMADTSEDYEGIGVAVLVRGFESKKVVGGLHTFVLRDNKKKTDQNYRQYIFRNPEIRKKLQKIANGVSVYGISKTNLSKIILNLPPLDEQKQIAKILEIWDRAIEGLGKKIEVKKRIKKGLMWGLLTGKARLPGFSGEWTKIKLRKIAKTSSGGTPKSNNPLYYIKGAIPWVNSGEVRKGKISNFDNFITEEGLKNSSAKLFPKETILIAMYGATTGQVGILEREAATNQAICGIIPNKNYSSLFLYYFFTIKTNQLIQMASGAAQPNISQDIIRNFDVLLPLINEQDAIANILTATDNEIIELERKLGILKNQKKFLLNNLVTGEIRVPEGV